MAIPTAPMSGPKRTVDFALISESFELVKNNWLPFCLWTLIGMIASYAVSFVVQLPGTIMQAGGAVANTPEAAIGAQIASLPFTILANIVTQALTGIVMGGTVIMTLKALNNERVDVADGFDAFKFAVPLALAGLLIGILSSLGILACCVGALVVTALLLPTYCIIVNEKLGVMDAIKRSVEVMKEHWLMASVFVLVMALIGGAGFLLCCLPGFFTMAMFYVSITLLYRDLFGTLVPAATVSPTNYPRSGDAEMPNYTGSAGTDPTPPSNSDDNPTPPQD